ncbi:MAG: substrate-binding domain-containing protein [Planctomycetaceae bacterium]|nr:substrate-binding domain-containing protein [Planctomycetaceae bacterium]
MINRKYIDLAELIESDIEAKKWQRQLPGVHALGKHYNVAPATVSRAVKVLSQKGRVTVQGTKGAFISNTMHNRPRYGVIGEVGLMHRRGEDMELQKIESEAANQKFGILTIGTSLELADASPNFYAQLPVDGLIFTNSILRKPIIAVLREIGIPFVSTNRIFETGGVDWVDYDMPRALKEALMLLSSQGHKHIALVGFKQTFTGLLDELRDVYNKFCHEKGTNPKTLWYETATNTEFWYMHGENYCKVYGYQSCETLMHQKQPPTAAIILSESVAESFCETLISLKKLNLPKDFSVITLSQNDSSLDDTPFFYGKIILPSMERTVKAMEILFKKITADKMPSPVQILLQLKIVTK